ncbi:hypothetical protein AVEN_51091-1 [Araneus ventricosus]|uniref:Uncharacterized protein n=1 Tax=Araneus ventricosus TaxID=182803 RepID=A0A4Y2N848_ARAVE|nr:hypothetical protein AVEN_51091-1 [Araneus ventricosus]
MTLRSGNPSKSKAIITFNLQLAVLEKSKNVAISMQKFSKSQVKLLLEIQNKINLQNTYGDFVKNLGPPQAWNLTEFGKLQLKQFEKLIQSLIPGVHTFEKASPFTSMSKMGNIIPVLMEKAKIFANILRKQINLLKVIEFIKMSKGDKSFEMDQVTNRILQDKSIRHVF